MKFSYQEDVATKGELSYVEQDKAIDFRADAQAQRPGQHGPSAALIVDKTLQAEFLIDNGQVLYVWGYLPRESWKVGREPLVLDGVLPGRVIVRDVDNPVVVGAAYRTNLDDSPARHHEESGHLVIGDPSTAQTLVEIATGTIIGLKGDQLACVVLRPTMR